MDTTVIYTQLGRMAYAVAKSNGEVKEKEIENLFNFIDEEIKHTGNSDAMILGAEFNKLRKMNASAKEAFSRFIQFISENGNDIHQRVKNLCIRLAMHIASTDESVDETEMAMINKLKKKLI